MRDIDGVTKYVAWGSGGFFRIVRNIVDLPFAYIVDNDAARWGSRVGELEVKGPQALLAEDPAKTAVVICSYALHAIKEQIMGLGEFKILVALNDVIYEDIRKYIEACYQEAQPKPAATSDTAIVVQGPVYPELTPRVLRHYALNYPELRIVLSTWRNTPEHLLREVEPFIDDLALSDAPAVPGLGNRNYQILSTQAGLALAAKTGAQRVLKTRSDMFLLAKGIFTQMERLRQLYEDGRCQAFGMEGRLVILDQCSNKFLPYSTSDLITYGHMADVQKYWDCPLDERDVEWDSYKPLRDISEGMFFPETWFSRHFAKNIGWPLKDTLADSFAFFRDLFIVVDTEWLGYFMEKYPYPQRYGSMEEVRNRVSHYFWQGLFFDNPAVWREAELFDVATENWYDTFKKP